MKLLCGECIDGRTTFRARQRANQRRSQFETSMTRSRVDMRQQEPKTNPIIRTEGPKWLSPAAVAMRLGISRAQVSRLAVKHHWKRLDVSTSPQARNAGVRYALSSIEEY